MRKILATILVVGLVFATFGGLPVLGEETEPEQSIGRYERITGSGELNENHVTQSASGLAIEGPSFTNTLRMDKGFLEAELGAWSASAAFSLDGDQVIFEGRKADFSPLEIGADPVFTLGSRDQVEFQERPMWVSTQQEELGGSITLKMEDGDSSGQQVYIARDWLWERGIQWFNATHEDGTLLPVTELAGGVLVEVHHFSEVYINPDGLDVKKVVGGLTVSNQGESRWFWQESVVEIDVDYNPSGDYVVLIGAEWLDLHLRPHAINVYASGGLETAINFPNSPSECNCYVMVNGVPHYSVEFTTSGLSVMIEVIGEHLPAYTMQGGELAPHWGEKRWNETAGLLEVDVAEKTSNYSLMVNKNWIDIKFPDMYQDEHSWSVEVVDGEGYYSYVLEPEQTPMVSTIEERECCIIWEPSPVPPIEPNVCVKENGPFSAVPATPVFADGSGSWFQLYQQIRPSQDTGEVYISYVMQDGGDLPFEGSGYMRLHLDGWDAWDGYKKAAGVDRAIAATCERLAVDVPYGFQFDIQLAGAFGGEDDCGMYWVLDQDGPSLTISQQWEVPGSFECHSGAPGTSKYVVGQSGTSELCLSCIISYLQSGGEAGDEYQFVPPFQFFGGYHVDEGTVPWLQNLTSSDYTQEEIDELEQEIILFQNTLSDDIDPTKYPIHLLTSLPLDVNTCGPANAPATPITGVITNEVNGASYQFYQYQGSSQGGVYVTWSLSASNIVPEIWSFGTRIWDFQDEVVGHGESDSRLQACYYLGQAPTSGQFHIFVEAGAGEWLSPAGCVVTTHWEAEINGEVGYSMTDGAGGSVGGSYNWGQSETCPEDNEPEFKTESLFRDDPEHGICISCLLEDIESWSQHLEP